MQEHYYIYMTYYVLKLMNIKDKNLKSNFLMLDNQFLPSEEKIP